MIFRRKQEEVAKPKTIADILTYQSYKNGSKKYIFLKILFILIRRLKKYVIKYPECLLFLVFVKVIELP